VSHISIHLVDDMSYRSDDPTSIVKALKEMGFSWPRNSL